MFHSLTIWLSDTNNADNALLALLGVTFGTLIIRLGFIKEDKETNSVPPQIDLWN